MPLISHLPYANAVSSEPGQGEFRQVSVCCVLKCKHDTTIEAYIASMALFPGRTTFGHILMLSSANDRLYVDESKRARLFKALFRLEGDRCSRGRKGRMKWLAACDIMCNHLVFLYVQRRYDVSSIRLSCICHCGVSLFIVECSRVLTRV